MKFYLKIFFFCLLILSCNSKKKKTDIDIGEVKIEAVEIKRLDKDLFVNDVEVLKNKIPEIRIKYKNFLTLFSKNILLADNIKDSAFVYKISNFIHDPDIKRIQEDCIKEFPDVNDLNLQFNNAFKHYKYYYPNKSTPEVITCVSGFNFPVYATDSVIAVGLDMYLGENSEYYRQLQIPKYKIHAMRKEYIVVDCMKALAYDNFKINNTSNTLISNMIYEGKIMYFLDAMLPDIDDTLKTSFKKQQLKWCIKNEYKIWAYLIEKNLFFTTNTLEINKFVFDAPFTAAFSKESPGRTGVWIGWQIVKAYMDNNKNITLPQLMNENDENKILSLSKYKPKK